MSSGTRPGLHPDFLRLPLAHRALHDIKANAPENSLPAIRAALAAGYGIEIDLQPSADGQAMVFHDDHLERLTHASGLVRAHTADALQRIRVRHSPEPIPTLREVLAEVGGRVPVLIEMKDQSGRHGSTDGVLEAATVAALDGYAGPVAVMSFNPEMVMRVAELAPHWPRGLTTYAFPQGHLPADATPQDEARYRRLAAIADFDRVGACFISHHCEDLDRPRVADLKARGAAVLCWTVTSATIEARARKVAQNITFEEYRPPVPQ